MSVYTMTKARTSLDRLIDQVAQTHKPIYITSKSAAAVLVSQEDWLAIQGTLSLLSIPGMGKSIKGGLKTPLKKCKKNLSW